VKELMKNFADHALFGVIGLCLLCSGAWAGDGGLAPVVNEVQQVAPSPFRLLSGAAFWPAFSIKITGTTRLAYEDREEFSGVELTVSQPASALELVHSTAHTDPPWGDSEPAVTLRALCLVYAAYQP
jgi:hypothetical protein